MNTYDTGIASLWHHTRANQGRELLITGAITALLAIEAALISRWAIAKLPYRPSYLAVFWFTTLFAWLFTFLALWDVIPSS